MNRLLIFSLLLVLAQTPVCAEPKENGEHEAGPTNAAKIIESWSSDRTSEKSFEASLDAIRRSLEAPDSLDSKKIELLSDWVNKLLNGQKVLLNRANSWLGESPSTLTQKSRDQLINLATLYVERVKRLEKVLAEIKTEAKLRADLNDLKQQLDAHRKQQNIQQENLKREQEKLEKALQDIEKQMLKDLIWA